MDVKGGCQDHLATTSDFRKSAMMAICGVPTESFWSRNVPPVKTNIFVKGVKIHACSV